MDIKVLYTLVAIAEHGSFLAASRTLGLSPAAISLHVKVIEEELGVSLFDRSVRPPTMTEAGRQTLSRARRVIEAWERLGEADGAERGGVLSFGAATTAIASLVAPALLRLRTERPHLRLTVMTASPEDLTDRVVRGLLDAALVMQPAAASLDLRFDPLLLEPLSVIVPADVIGSDETALLQSLPYIRYRSHAWLTHLVELEFGRRRLRVDTMMEIESISATVALVEQGLGAAIVPAYQLKALARANAIRSLPFGDPPVAFASGLLRRADHPKAPQLNELMMVLAGRADALSGGKKPEALQQREDEPQASDEAEIGT